MFELDPSVFQSLIPRLDDVPFNTWFARSVLAGHVNGRVFVDDLIDPSSVYIYHDYGMALLLGDTPSSGFADAMVKYLRSLRKSNWIQVFPDLGAKFLQCLVDDGTVRLATRINFVFDQDRFEPILNKPMPDRLVVTDGTTNLIRQIEGRVVPRYFWKRSELNSCVSRVAFVDHEYAGIAFASFLHGDVLEIGTETAEPYRRMGVAENVCSALIRYCLAEGLTPVWACRQHNTGSMKLAQRLGFVETISLPYYCVDP